MSRKDKRFKYFVFIKAPKVRVQNIESLQRKFTGHYHGNSISSCQKPQSKSMILSAVPGKNMLDNRFNLPIIPVDIMSGSNMPDGRLAHFSSQRRIVQDAGDGVRKCPQVI